MTEDRTFVVPNLLIPGAIGVAVIATAGLIAFPGNPLIWQIGAWTLAGALLALLGLVLAAGISLATSARARTWQRMVSFAAGLVVLAIVAVGWV